MSQTWRPTASLKNLQARAEILSRVRAFFAERQVLEVETPILNGAGSTDVYIESFITHYQHLGLDKKIPRYMQTSPEFAMKRLLAAGSGAIFQLCKSFRNGESGHQHRSEFTLLEWYRPGFDHHDLMIEMDAFLQHILKTKPATQYRYADLFQEQLAIDIHQTHCEQLKQCALQQNIQLNHIENIDHVDTWLQLLMSHCIEPTLGKDAPAFVYDFPATQAALAKINPGPPAVAERFEVYFKGIELANGFHELQNAAEQKQRFLQDQQQRQQQNLPAIPFDQNLIAALEHGLPDCAGVALGIDRLIMLALNEKHIANVISFAQSDF